MASVGAGFAEVYMMRKLHKEKMKRTEKERSEREVSHVDGESKVPGGCFFSMFKKIHPNDVSSADVAGEQAGKFGHVKICLIYFTLYEKSEASLERFHAIPSTLSTCSPAIRNNTDVFGLILNESSKRKWSTNGLQETID
ncbi:hypothetical protein L1049_025389 [Liquidambar formosana]|uniref:Uncharacterized protein n=1 Tax=Liquidambar formosana TaxID=63359 RepID=A0AAP0NCP7_LIQFO